MTTARPAPRWFVAGDFNGFFGLVVDNLSILGFIAMALVGIFQFPADVVFGRMFPGTAFGVLVGNLLYTLMARRLAARTRRDDVTAMPLGLDAPTSIGMALLVLGPAFLAFKQQGLDPHAAAIATWQLGMASLMVMGVLKFVLSFAGDWITRVVPRAALLGSIGGAALMLLGFLPLIETLRSPVRAELHHHHAELGQVGLQAGTGGLQRLIAFQIQSFEIQGQLALGQRQIIGLVLQIKGIHLHLITAGEGLGIIAFQLGFRGQPLQ